MERLPIQVYEKDDGLYVMRDLPNGDLVDLNLYDTDLDGLLIATLVRLYHIGKLGPAIDSLLAQVRAGEVDIL